MRLHRVVAAAAGYWLALTGASAQSAPGAYGVKKCDDPKVGIGMLRKGSGQVSYQLSKDGKPDTASIVVVSVAGISVGGFRSVAVRELSACRHEMGKAAPKAAVGVVQQIMFAGDSIQVGAAVLAPAPGAPLAVEPLGLPIDSFPLPLEDARLEERPRNIRCQPPNGPPPQVSGSGRGNSQAAAQAQARSAASAAAEDWNRTNAGSMLALLRIGTNGKPDPAVRVLNSSNPLATQNLTNMATRCEFVPGRYHGIIVPAYFRMVFAFGPISMPSQ